MNIFDFLRLLRHLKLQYKDYKLLATWVLCYIAASLLPIWGGAIWHRLDQDAWPTIASFTQNGEFALLASSLLGAIFFSLFRENGLGKFPGTFIIGPISLIAIVVSTIFFSRGMSSVGAPSTGSWNFMAKACLTIYIVVAILSIVVLLIESQIDRIPIRGQSQDQLSDLRLKVRARRNTGENDNG